MSGSRGSTGVIPIWEVEMRRVASTGQKTSPPPYSNLQVGHTLFTRSRAPPLLDHGSIAKLAGSKEPMDRTATNSRKNRGLVANRVDL